MPCCLDAVLQQVFGGVLTAELDKSNSNAMITFMVIIMAIIVHVIMIKDSVTDDICGCESLLVLLLRAHLHIQLYIHCGAFKQQQSSYR